MKNFTAWRNARLFAIILSIVLLPDLLVYASTVEETFKKRIPFREAGYLELSNSNGNVDVKSWDNSEVEIIAYKKVRASSKDEAEKFLNELKIDIVQSADEIKIETITPHSLKSGGGFFDWLFGSANHSFSVEYEIKVPKSIDLNIKTTNGKIFCQQIKGRLRLGSTNGKITARQIEGLVRASSTNGSLDIELLSVPADEEINFSTTNGSITLHLPENYGAKIDLQTTNGHIDSDFPYTVERSRSRQHVWGSIGSSDGDLYCHTTNGDIRLYSVGKDSGEDLSL